MKAGVILDIEATPAYRTDEVNATRTMIDRVESRFDMKPSRLIGDTAYGTAEMLGWMVEEKNIEPHVPVWDKTERTEGHSRETTSSGMTRTTNIAAQKERLCDLTKEISRPHVPLLSPRTTRLSIGPRHPTARTAR